MEDEKRRSVGTRGMFMNEMNRRVFDSGREVFESTGILQSVMVVSRGKR